MAEGLFSQNMYDLYTNNDYVNFGAADLDPYRNQPTWNDYFPTKIGGDYDGYNFYGTEEPRSWFDRVPGASWNNAGITIALSAIPSFLDAISSSNIYKLYRTQEQLAIQNADIQAKRLQRKGEIALANLETKHALTEGKNELALAGAGATSISGTFLDKLMANRKYDVREEFAQQLETTYAVANAKREGLINAVNVAGSAMSHAYEKRSKYISNLLNGIYRATENITADIKQTYYQDAMIAKTEAEYNKKEAANRLFNAAPEQNTSASLNINNQEITFDNTPYPGIQPELTKNELGLLHFK